MKKLIFANKKWILMFICCIVFIIILERVFQKEVLTIDSIICNKIIYIQTDWLTTIMKIITKLSNAVTLIIICTFVLIFLKEKKYGICMSFNLILIAVFNVILKYIVQRPRPNLNQLIIETGYSFPSGHSMGSMAFYGLIIYFIYNSIKNKYIKWSLCILFVVLIFLIGVSRIYLGVHYPSDVVAGFFIALAYLLVFTNKIKTVFTNNKLL